MVWKFHLNMSAGERCGVSKESHKWQVGSENIDKAVKVYLLVSICEQNKRLNSCNSARYGPNSQEMPFYEYMHSIEDT